MALEVQHVRGLFVTNEKYGISQTTLNQKVILADIEGAHPDLIRLILSDELATALFFEDVSGVKVLLQNKLIAVLFQLQEFMAGSFTSKPNAIGMFVCEGDDVQLSFPYQDCVLVGGMSSEDVKSHTEVFYNEVLAKDRIDKLFEPKIFCNTTRYTCDGHAVTSAPASLSVVTQITSDGDEREVLSDNLVVKGNNLLALHTLAARLRGCVDVIYIDPPYFFKDSRATDTFAYNSNFKLSSWLTFMKNRLEIARELLAPGGVIFVQVGEDGLEYLALLMKDLFGFENNLGLVSRVQKKGSDKGTFFKPDLDYILCYAKKKALLPGFRAGVDPSKFKLTETEGPRAGELYEASKSLYQSSLDPLRGCANQRYFIECPDGSLVIPPGSVFPSANEDGAQVRPVSSVDKVWRWSAASCLAQKHLLVFKETKDSPLVDASGKKSKWNVYTKRYLSDAMAKGNVPSNLISEFPNDKGTDELKALKIDFAYPKPTGLIRQLIQLAGNKQAVVLDFFAGSGTTAHAVLELNKLDDGTRKFILVEQMDYAETVTAERIKRAMEKDGYAASFVYAELLKDPFKERLQRCTQPAEIHQLVAQHFDRGLFPGVTSLDDLKRKTILAGAKETIEDAAQSVIKLLLEQYFDHNTEYPSIHDFIEHAPNLAPDDVAVNESFFRMETLK